MNTPSQHRRSGLMLHRMRTSDLLTWPAITAITVWSVAFHLYGNGAAISVNVPQRIAIALIATAIMFAVVAGVGRALASRGSADPSATSVIATFTLAAAVRAAFIQATLAQIDRPPPRLLSITHVISGTLLMTMFLIATAYVVAGYTESRERYAALALETQRLTTTLEKSGEITQRQQANALERVRSILDSQFVDIQSASADNAVDSLLSLAENVVRPMSHELSQSIPRWDPPDVDRIRVTWPGIWEHLNLEGAARPVLIPIVLAISAIPTAVPMYGARTAGVMIGLSAILVPAALIAVRRAFGPAVRRLSPAGKVPAITGALVLAAMPAAAVLASVPGPGPYRYLYAQAMLIELPSVGWLIALGTAALRELESVNAQVERVNEQLRWTIARIRMVQWQQQRRLSQALHGPVQSLLHATIRRIQISTAARSADDEFMQQEYGRLQRDAIGLLAANVKRIDVRTEFDDLRVGWRGVCDVDVMMDDDIAKRLDADQTCAVIMTDIVSEATSNAIRHGGAHRVDVMIAYDDVADDRVSLTVTDNGDIVPGEERRGVGTEQLDQCAITWTRVIEPGVRRLTATLPLESLTPTFGVSRQR